LQNEYAQSGKASCQIPFEFTALHLMPMPNHYFQPILELIKLPELCRPPGGMLHDFQTFHEAWFQVYTVSSPSLSAGRECKPPGGTRKTVIFITAIENNRLRNNVMKTNGNLIYNEKVSSKWTQALFLALTILSFLLFIWRVTIGNWDALATIFLCLFFLFLFYSVNYGTLLIRLTEQSLKLTFGIFTWTIPFENIEYCQPDDDLPVLMKYGGAGIHFMMIRKRYRVSFNFLEHSRVVIGLKRRAGLVKDVSFSTCQPTELVQLIQGAILANKAA